MSAGGSRALPVQVGWGRRGHAGGCAVQPGERQHRGPGRGSQLGELAANSVGSGGPRFPSRPSDSASTRSTTIRARPGWSATSCVTALTREDTNS